MRILITGAAGFIGYHLSSLLLSKGHQVVGIDNINDYYDVNLKYARLNELGIQRESASEFLKEVTSGKTNNFKFIRMNLEDTESINQLFEKEKFEVVCNLAAQAGVRYSIENPHAYVESNIVGYVNLLEACRNTGVKHLVYASSSSVYGLNSKIPFSTDDTVDTPISLYAASKKSNELMAHTYSHLFGFATTGLRFFTVYGPWGRPDMAAYLFAEGIRNNQPIKVFNHGKMERDFTYVGDIVEGVMRIIEGEVDTRKEKGELYKVYNIGNNNSVKLTEYIENIEKNLGKEAEKIMMDMQPGDVAKTWADVSALIKDYGYSPNTSVEEGVKKFIDWYKKYNNLK
ncbi:capsule biosynthesis protein CapI [Wenyingzhuangia fucanilytica]|uniref:Capsule biosynthesis protein CapI n=1 Tax=Wenyingzhuangia fucanilytica TaxID=1790137 RepID=A0A1B1Y2J1_9FLAO|nr:NAD-dependent epimerase [Wenyingzhuangia fucanilytica]ANW94957.1 capsule biosynthesis protein CapI [Wenyingzhuangia fucanilytica]